MGILESFAAWIGQVQLLVSSISVLAARGNPLEARDFIPKPVVIPASQNFEGNDGSWSTFALQIGTPAQVVNVLISTAGYQTWAVAPQGCSSSDPRKPADCEQLRGGMFNKTQSTTWAPNTLVLDGSSRNATDGFTLGLENNLGYSGEGQYGFDTVTLGWQGSGGPSLDDQIVASIGTNMFFLGIFGTCCVKLSNYSSSPKPGLNPRPSNFSTFTDPKPSYLSNLKKQNMIPSLSWAYTAGNQYRFNKVLGSLTLGGYDASRFIPNNLTISFNERDVRDLTVNINAISMLSADGSQRSNLLPSSIAAFVYSTIPWIYLPVEACKKFEDAFGITWNEQMQGYPVNDTLHNKLTARNASVIFTPSNSTSGSGPSFDITLPFAAFDLVLEYPLVRNTTRYFPLARAANESQYTLGRTFLQEAYLIADYERRNFSISQCSWVENAQQDITVISMPVNVTNTGANQHLSSGGKAGIAVGSLAAASAVGLVLYFFFIRQWRIQRVQKNDENSGGSESSTELAINEKPLEIDGTRHLGTEIDGKPHRGPELYGKPYPGQEIDGKMHPGSEVEGSNRFAQELATKDVPAAEMDTKYIAATELPA
ncbi:MAG: hypothetical protein L6R38_009717 [Xanthoria sp. 2 TBL-2021]|nr:MAG: hypothetical protein L6R38_009717 [Xanthoria sp. 2 TBL-2021]